MVSDFDKIFKDSTPVPKGTRTFKVSLTCVETKQHMEYTHPIQVCDIYKDQSELRLKLMEGLDALIKAFIRTLPI